MIRNLLENTYFASCPQETEGLLAKELHDLQAQKLQVSRGGVLFTVDPFKALKILTHSRIASRLFRRIKHFPCQSEEDIYQAALAYPWNRLLNNHQTFKVQTLLDRESKSAFPPSFHLSLRVKDALCDQWKESAGGRPSVEKKDADNPLLLHLEKQSDQFKGSLYLDITGRSLSHRGYRPAGHRAPLRENLAASLILSSDWSPEQDLFCDPFCGTGTLLAEAVLIKAKIPPSYLQIARFFQKEQPYVFLKQKWFQKDQELFQYWKNLAQEIADSERQGMKNLLSNQFFGNDRDKKAFALAVQTFINARIPRDIISLSSTDACYYSPPGEAPGLILSNPPYGERITSQTIEKIYYNFGENLKNNWTGWRVYLLTSDSELRKKIELRTSSRVPFCNGNLECRLLKYELY